MSFKRKLPAEPIPMEHFKGGAGTLQRFDILRADEMYGKGRVCAIMRLEPGCEVGRHRHEGDGEVYYILSGTGEYLLDGALVDVAPGDVLFCDDGEEHYLKNTGDTDMEMLALVLFSN